MRLKLFYNPCLLIERLAIESQRHKRLKKLKGTVASVLQIGHIDSLELLELARSKPPHVIYDIGANIGTWTLLAKALFPNATIHAFEPLTMHYELLKKSAHKITDFSLHKVALGSKAEVKNMQVASFSDASSLLKITDVNQTYFGITKAREEPVDVVTLDEYVTTNHLPLPDLIKLDIQGYELEALHGGENCLLHAQWIVCEVSFIEFYKEQPLFEDIVSFLHQQGFCLYALGVNTLLGEKLVQTDALFIRSSK